MSLMEALHQDERELRLPQTTDAHTALQLSGDKKVRTHKVVVGWGWGGDCAVEADIQY